MRFIRCILAELGLAYVPQIGEQYRYSIEGPFELGAVATPMEIRQGFVQYDLLHTNGLVTHQACDVGTFASMFKQVPFYKAKLKPVQTFTKATCACPAGQCLQVPPGAYKRGDGVWFDAKGDGILKPSCDTGAPPNYSEMTFTAAEIEAACEQVNVSLIKNRALLVELHRNKKVQTR